MSHKILFLVVLTTLAACLSAQQCSGNLGENIFEAGDFGSGTANILTPDPGIAPGFLYQPNPPPNDGFYTITNDMGAWSYIFPSWDAFSDNSNDPNGYMMVVNAAFSPGKFYEQQVDDLCENTLYQFSADVRNILSPGSNGLTPNVSFSIDDVTRFTSGAIGETGRWNTYGFTFTTAPGQTSVVLALSNNAPGGNGNDLAIDNISFRACGPLARIAGEEMLSICEDGEPAVLTSEITGGEYDDPQLQWQQSFDDGVTWQDLPGEMGMTFTHTGRTSGFYYYRYLLANGPVNLTNNKCRVVSNVKTVYVIPKRYEVVDTICEGMMVAVGASEYRQTGVSVDTLLSSLGCDSIVTLRLTVVSDPDITGDFTVTDPSCSYLTDGSVELVQVNNGTEPFRFTFGGMTRSLGTSITGLGQGDFAYRIADRYGCAEEGTISLVTPNPFAIEMGEPRVVDLGESILLTDGTNDAVTSYNFSPPGLVDCTEDCDGARFTPAESGTLYLVATSPRGCEARDSLRYVVVKNRKVYPPNAFSPNGDGINDYFTLFAAVPNVTAINSLNIFDRWGGQVFGAENLEPNLAASGWDGSTDGEPARNGVYYYTASVRFLDGAVLPYAGSFTLLR
ncbi:T9SS type B sorting domain-containing protein [Neolewinella aurantiaca]|nr:gliding motility-associated C-terminal domain-containing protein [Neolewinella aurantiaca]